MVEVENGGPINNIIEEKYFCSETEKPIMMSERQQAIQNAGQEEYTLFIEQYIPFYEAMADSFIDYASSPARQDRTMKLVEKLAVITEARRELYPKATQASSMSEASLIQAAGIGSELVFLSTLTHLIQSHEGAANVKDDLDEYFRINVFELANSVTTKVGTTCLADFIPKPRLKNPSFSIAPYLEFLILTLIYQKNEEYIKVASFNEQYPISEYPNFTILQIGSSLSGTTSIINILKQNQNPYMLDSVLRNSSIPRETRTQIIEATKSILDGVSRYIELAYQALLNPDHPQFTEVSSLLTKYLSGTMNEKIYALEVLGLNSFQKVGQIYRTADGFIKKDMYLEIYQPLLLALDDLIQAYSRVNTVLTSDYLPDILTQTDYEGAIPNFAELDKHIGEIFSMISNREPELDIESIDWGGFIKPQAAEIKFASSPKRFTIILIWQNEAEILKLQLEFDTTKGVFDWSFHESPDEQKMSLAKRAAFSATVEILSQLKKVAKDLIQDRLKQEMTPRTPQTTPSQRQQRMASYSKEEKTEKDNNKPTILKAFQELETERQGREIKRTVVIPADLLQLKEVLSEIGENDHDRVICALKEFNEGGGKGKGFKRLSTLGSPKYEISIGSIGGGQKGIRVILLPIEASEGLQKFSVYTVWYRGDAFKIHRKRQLRSI